ncbi:hypothetical protein HY419_01150, partial [candidate division WWE3 bacterium]|nr:hypothetical protein [candidate division WWE3 bacterium]
MKFSNFSKYLLKLENTSKRLEITEILSKLIKELDLAETEEAIYLCLGQLGPSFARIDFALAEKMMLRIIKQTYDVPKEKIRELYASEGDLGNVAEKLSKRQKTARTDLSISEVYEKLTAIALVNGEKSQEKKVSGFVELLKSLDSLSTRYAVRIPIGNTRLGFSEITVIEALSWLKTGDKSLKKEIESHYNVYPDIGRVTKQFKKGGLKALEEIRLEVGVPVLPQLCQRVSTAEEAIEKLKGNAGGEYKYDGTRVQLHLDRKRKTVNKNSDQLSFFKSGKDIPFVKTFTRNLEETTNMFPDIIKAALKQIAAESVIVDGEAVGIDPKTGRLIPFQETSQRIRR